jgi:hypothetical protein
MVHTFVNAVFKKRLSDARMAERHNLVNKERRPTQLVCTPGKILKSRVPEMRFQAFWGEILQNSEDYKVHRRHKFSQIFLIFYS